MYPRLPLVLVGLLFAAAARLGAAPASIGYFEAVKNDPAPVVGHEYYLRHCIMHEKGTHVATNYWRGELTPINTKVKLVSMGGETMVLSVDGTGETVKVKNVPSYTKCDIQAIAARMLSPQPIPIEKLGEAMASAIQHGTMKLGMTKEEVVMARGYPPAHKTPSLADDRWEYWSSRFVVQTIVFTDGVLTQGRGIE